MDSCLTSFPLLNLLWSFYSHKGQTCTFIETVVMFCFLKLISFMGINNRIGKVDDDSIISRKRILNWASKRWWNDMKPCVCDFFLINETKRKLSTKKNYMAILF